MNENIRCMSFWKIVLAFCISLIVLFILFVAIGYFSLRPDIEDLGNGYEFINEHPKGINKNYHVVVPARVIELGWDDRYIVAVQIPDIGCIDENDRNKYPQIHDHRFYWIIDKETDQVYGPLLYDEYKQKEDTLMAHNQIWMNIR